MGKTAWMTTESDSPFWGFSLALYGGPGVADACLSLQDRHGLDVNLLLFCCWAGAQGRALDASDVARLLASVEDWQRSVVRPLRQVRRRLKGLAAAESGRLGDLRRAIKDCELAAERIEQAILHDALPPSAPQTPPAARQAACAAANLAVYLEVAGVPIGSRDGAELETLLRGAFGTLPSQTAARWFPE